MKAVNGQSQGIHLKEEVIAKAACSSDYMMYPSASNKTAFVSSDDIGPNDVLLGRGFRINSNPGNVAFRSLVASRKARYLDSNTNKEKKRIAREIVDCVSRPSAVGPPGRFLERVYTSDDKAEQTAKDFPDGAVVWRVVDENVAMEKAKQSLRQQQRGGEEHRKRPPAGQKQHNEPQPRAEGGAGGNVTSSMLELSVSEHLRGSKEHDAEHDASMGQSSSEGGNGFSSNSNVDEISLDGLEEWIQPPIDAPELLEQKEPGKSSLDATRTLISFDDIGPNDVLLGRGFRINGNPGNVAFRSLVASRKPRYLDSDTIKEKNRIAREIFDRVRSAVPPGRFLERVSKAALGNMGLPDDVEMWCAVDEKIAIEKTKQSLRQQQRWGEQRKGSAASRSQAECETTDTGVIKQSMNEDSPGQGLIQSSMSEDSPGRKDDDTRHDVAKNNAEGISLHDLREWMPPMDDDPEVLACTGRDDVSMGMNSIENVFAAAAEELGVAPSTDKALFPAQLGHARTYADNVMDTQPMSSFDSQIIAEGGLAFAGVMNQTDREERKESSRGGRINLLESVRQALELVENVLKAHAAVDGSHLTGEQIRSDLVSLGSVLYRRFAGVDPFNAQKASIRVAEEDARAALNEHSCTELPPTKKDRHTQPQKYVPLRDLGLPVSLCILVSSLLDAKDDDAMDRYATAEEVEEDLRLMLCNPFRYLFDAGTDNLRWQLESTKEKLYGRDDEISNLMEVFKRATSGSSDEPREMVLISGYSGTGKSALAEQLRQPVAEKNGQFVSGKFDPLGQAQPMSVIFSAFNEYCNNIVEGDSDNLAQISGAIHEALGVDGVSVLTGLIPNLRKVIGEPTTEPVQVGGKQARNRVLFCFRLFLRALASPCNPIVLLLDDLQWADKELLEFISTIVSDYEIRALLFVGSYRDSEIGDDHPLKAIMGSLVLEGVDIANIRLENIDRRNLNSLVSDTLTLSPRLTWSLADTVHSKTGGNPLFAVQFLQSLYDDHLLQYSARSRRWEWDVAAILSKGVAGNVVELMTKKMLKLDLEGQWFLKMAACLGSQFQASTLKLLSLDGASDELGTTFILDTFLREGLMCKMRYGYQFSHDQIQQAAYSLIPVSGREATHLNIARSLWKQTPKEGLDRIIFTVIDQLQRGSDLISDHDEKVDFARLCLLAGKKAIASSSFMQAVVYLLQGTALLDESDWENHYNLSLELFSCCVEAQYAQGCHNELTITVKPIFAHGRCLQDKMPAILNHMRSAGNQNKCHDVIGFGLNILAQLGEPFPIEINKETVKANFVKTREMCTVATVDGMLKKEKMQDPDKLASMQLLVTASASAYRVSQDLCSLLVFRMVQLTLCYGVCPLSPYAFASWGFVLCCFGEREQGYQYGKLALSLLDTLNAKEHVASVYLVVYNYICCFFEPLQAQLPAFKHGHEVGMLMGDIEFGLNCARAYCLSGIQGGRKLEPLAEEVKPYVQQMKVHGTVLLPPTLIMLQTILNLMGTSEDPTELTGEIMNQQDMLRELLEKKHLHIVIQMNYMRIRLAYMFRRYDIAAEMAESILALGKLQPMRIDDAVDRTFYTGLVAIVMARDGGGKDWRDIAHETLEKMKVWAGNSAWNFQHKLVLLSAEMSYLGGDRDEAAELYDDAIRIAGEHKFIHEQALAYERAGIFHSEEGSQSIATEYFGRAHELYLDWGAKKKAQDLFLSNLASFS